MNNAAGLLPPARIDGRCVLCEKSAEEYGQKLCRACVLARKKEFARLDRIQPRDLSRRGTEEIGRPMRHPSEYGEHEEHRDGVKIG